MVKTKTITIKKKGGGTRKQKVQVLKSGKYKFVKNDNSRSKKLTKKSKKTTKRRIKRMPKKRKSRSRKFTLPLAPIVGITVAVAPAVREAMVGNFEGAAKQLRNTILGIDDQGTFHIDWMMQGLGPIVAGLLVHKFVGGSPLNLNRMLASANVPLIRI